MSVIEIRITAPDAEVARAIATTLIDRRLAACVQEIPRITSTYVWDGQTERAEETLLLIKTTGEAFAAVCDAVTSIHPAQVPEILAVPVDQALPAYRDWVVRFVEIS